MNTVSIRLIRPSPNPIRKTWDEDKMNELAASIWERGVIVPIKVRPISEAFRACRYHGIDWLEGVQLNEHDEACLFCNELRSIHGIYQDWEFEEDEDLERGDPFLEVVYGHRRVEAARRAGLTEIPALVESPDDTDALIEALIENVQREDMNPIDEAKALKALVDSTGWSYMEIERRGVMNNVQVSDRISLLAESPEIQSLIRTSTPGPTAQDRLELGVRHIKEVRGSGLDLPDRTAVLLKAADEQLTRHETRAVADAYKAAPTPELKDAVLNTSGKLGDADRILQVAQMKVSVNGIAREREYMERKSVEEWDRSVAEFLDMFKLFDRSITKTITAAEYDKFSPEAKTFTVRRIDGLIANLQKLRGVLSNE